MWGATKVAWERVVRKKEIKFAMLNDCHCHAFLKVIVLMIRGVDEETFRTWDKIEAIGMAWKWLCIYLGSY